MPEIKPGTRILRAALPPGVSVAVHTVLVILLIVVGSRLTPEPAPKKRQVVLSEIESAPAPTQRDDDTQDSAQASRQSPERSAQAARPDDTLALEARSLANEAANDPALPGVNESSAASSMDALEMTSGVRFAGFRAGAAARIVYCVDVSGATATSLTYIRERLLQSIDLLSPTQKFQVVVFRDLGDKGVLLAPLGGDDLARATRENKDAVAQWLAVMPAAGRSNPLEGLRAAVELAPDLILLISRAIERTNDDPWAGGLANVRSTLDELNPIDPRTGQRRVVIKTVQLLDEDPTNIMRAIGTLHGDGSGDHSVVTYEALATPDTTAVRSAPRTALPARAASVLDTLGSSGALLRASIGAPTTRDILEIRASLTPLTAAIDGAETIDASAMMLAAQTALLAIAVERPAPKVPESLRTSVFVDPSGDALRRIVLAQLDAARGNGDDAVQSLKELLNERDELGISPERVAQACVTLASFGGSHDDTESITSSEPFVVRGAHDPGWSLMLAWARSVGAHRTDQAGVYTPILDLEGRVLGRDDVEHAVIEMSKLAPDAPRSDRVRLILAREAIRVPKSRRAATDELLVMGTTLSDPELASVALWSACLGAAADSRSGTLTEAALAFADQFPRHPRTIDALASAIQSDTHRRTDTTQTLLRRAIELGAARPERDLWALALAPLLNDPSERAALVSTLTPETRESDLGAELVHADALNRAFTSDAAELAAARETLELMNSLGSPLAPVWARRVALLEVELDPSRAIERLSAVEDPDARISVALAQALVNAGRPSHATEILTELVSMIADEDPLFWDAWALLIETIAEHGDAAARDAALAHLARLEIIDPEFGGGSSRSRLTHARRTLHSEP